MDDRFLYQNRPPVRTGFSESLYARLSSKTSQNKETNKGFKFALRLVLAGLLLFAVLFTFSEPVRASVLDWIKHVAGFDVTDSQPDFNTLRREDYYYTPQPAEDVLQDPPFAFSIPSYLPDGYLPHETVVANSKAWVSLSWESENEERIGLMVQQDWNMTIPASTDDAKEIQINGQQALLLRGWWNENGKWDKTKKVIQLYWRQDGLIYILSSSTVSEAELIRIAESIK